MSKRDVVISAHLLWVVLKWLAIRTVFAIGIWTIGAFIYKYVLAFIVLWQLAS